MSVVQSTCLMNCKDQSAQFYDFLLLLSESTVSKSIFIRCIHFFLNSADQMIYISIWNILNKSRLQGDFLQKDQFYLLQFYLVIVFVSRLRLKFIFFARICEKYHAILWDRLTYYKVLQQHTSAILCRIMFFIKTVLVSIVGNILSKNFKAKLERFF